MKLPVRFANRYVVDAGLSASHEAVCVEFPLFVTVRAVPVAGIVVPLVLEAHGNPVLVERPKFFDKAIVEFLCPFARQKFDDGLASVKKLGAVSPAAVLRISQRQALRIA